MTRRIRAAVDLWVDCFNDHQILDHASAIALRALVALIPLTLKKLGADPATASSIFLTTASDVASMGIFLSLATAMLPSPA